MASFLTNSFISEIIDCTCLRREADPDLEQLAPVSSIRQGIALVLYLSEGNGSSGVELELEDIDIIGTFEHAVDSSLARLFFNIDVVLAEQQHDEIEGILEVTLAFTRVCLPLEAVGDIGEECRQLQLELFYIASSQASGNIDKP